MKNILTIIGVLLIIFGIVTFAYKGFSYNKEEKVAEIAGLKVMAQETKTVYFPPILGGLSIAAGIALVLIARIKK